MKPVTKAGYFNRHTSKVKQAGLTLVELSIALAIGAVITIVGVIFANDALKEARISGEAARMNSIIMKARAAFANTSYVQLGADATVVAATMGVFPKDMLSNGDPASFAAANTVTNRWGGVVTLLPDAANNLFVLSYVGIPRSDCMEFLNRVESLFNTINTGAVYAADAAGPTVPKAAGEQLNFANLAASCAAGAAGTQDFAFGFSK